MFQGQACAGDSRVILHIDLDCFYAQASLYLAASLFLGLHRLPKNIHRQHSSYYIFLLQVEQRRLGIPRDIPVAVQQWEGLIAVNYAARAKGITRHMRIAEAKIKCPELTLVHVETIGGDEPKSGAAQHDGQNKDLPVPDGSAVLGASSRGALHSDHLPNDNDDGTKNGSTSIANTSTAHLRLTEKACLERYRRANTEILKILHKLAPTSVIEKASIDEVYIDVTSMVDAELEAQHSTASAAGYHKGHESAEFPSLGEEELEPSMYQDVGNNTTLAGVTINNHNNKSQIDNGVVQRRPEDAFAWGSVVPGGPLDPGSEFDVRLACGAGIACRLRGAVRDQLGYTSSAGIACNKLLAKIGSAMHKPDQQTVIPPRAVPALMHDLPLKKVRNFGGKLGQQLESMGCTTAGQVAALPLDSLKKVFGVERAQWMLEAVNGRSNDPVEEKERPKSMLAAKSFSATSDQTALRRWFHVLATELAPRMANDEESFHRRSRTLTVHFRGGATPGQDRSRQGPMPRMPHNGAPCAETIAGAAWEIFKARCAGEALPCNRLAISAGEFASMPTQGKSAITNFLVARPPPSGNGAGKGDDGSKNENIEKKRPDTVDNKPNSDASVFDMGRQQVKVRRLNDSCRAVGSSDPAAAAGDAANTKEKHAKPVEELPPELLGVDISEQKRLLKEATMLKALEEGKKRGGGSGGGGSGNNIKGKSGQPNISRFFVKKS